MQKQKWDYLFIVEEEGRPRYVNGQEIPNWEEGPNIFSVINQLGWKGWIQVSNDSAWLLRNPLTRIPMIFRRPKN